MKKKLRIVHVAYVTNNKVTDPEAWLKKLSFFTVVLEKMTLYGRVFNFDFIGFGGVLKRNGVIHCFKRVSKIQLLFPVLTHRRIKKLRPDAVIVHGLIFPWQVILLRWQLGRRVKIILQHHADKPFKDFRQYLQRWADCYVNAYLFASVESGRDWVGKGQIRTSSKIKEIMGTSSTFYPMDRKQAKAITTVSGDKIFLWIGRLDANKDPWVVAKAFNSMAESYPEISLYMIYTHEEPETDLENLLKKSGTLGKTIHLVGEVVHEQLMYWYNSGDFIVSSSHYEGSGISVCEAMSCGCIPILTNIPSFQMMTDGGRIGFLYEPGDVNGLYSAIEQSLLLDQSSEREKVLSHFEATISGDANARKIMEVINE